MPIEKANWLLPDDRYIKALAHEMWPVYRLNFKPTLKSIGLWLMFRPILGHWAAA